MKFVTLLRGLGGSGKKKVAETLAQDGDLIVSADEFFINPDDGTYHFDGLKVPQAHADCISRTSAAMSTGVEGIFVCNTFTQEWEMQPYYKLAKQNGYMVFSLIVENRHEGTRNSNRPEVKRRMEERFEVAL